MEELLRTPVSSDSLSLSSSPLERNDLLSHLSFLFVIVVFQDDQPEHLREIGLQQTRLEMILKADKLINEEDLISSTRKFGQLGNLYQSLVSRVELFRLSFVHIARADSHCFLTSAGLVHGETLDSQECHS